MVRLSGRLFEREMRRATRDGYFNSRAIKSDLNPDFGVWQ